MWVGRQAWTWRVVTFDHAPVHSARSDIAPRVHVTVGLLLCRTKRLGCPRETRPALVRKEQVGRLDGDGNLVLSSEEVLFCHWNRHVSLPSEAWLEEELEGDPTSSNVLSFLTWLAPGGNPRHQ